MHCCWFVLLSEYDILLRSYIHCFLCYCHILVYHHIVIVKKKCIYHSANITLVSLETFFDLTEFWEKEQIKCRVRVMVFNTTFNNILVILWRSVLLVKETRGTGKTTNLSQVTDKLYHVMVYSSPWSRFELTTSGHDGSHKKIYFFR